MRETPGKATARALFYRDCLPRWLSPVQCASGNVLLLLGRERRELPFLDALHVARQRVYSVERALDVYAEQVRWNDAQPADQRVNLHFGHLEEYLRFRLHGDQGFGVLNLDVEGSFLHGIDPAMTWVLLYSWFNPATVVATYHSCARDRLTLVEGIVSLALLQALTPDAASSLFTRLVHDHSAARSTHAPAHMALRECAWIGRILVHALRASTVTGSAPRWSVTQLNELRTDTWSALLAGTATHRALTLGTLQRAVRGVARTAFAAPLSIGVDLTDALRLTYNSSPCWTQLCTFARFSPRVREIGLVPWVERLLARFVQHPLLHVDRAGRQLSVLTDASPLPSGLRIWPDRRFRSCAPADLPHTVVDGAIAARCAARQPARARRGARALP